MTSKISIIFLTIGLILMIISLGYAVNLLPALAFNILKVTGALFVFIGVLTKNRKK